MAFHFTTHAKKRLKKRRILPSHAKRASYGSSSYLGAGRYKSTRGGVTTIFVKKGSKRRVITAWKKD